MHKIKYFSIFLLFFFLFSSFNPSAGIMQLKTVVLDAGHGGKDPGTKGKYSKEKDIALKVVLKVRNQFKKYKPNVKTILTRSSDVFVDLLKRGEIANKNKADVFVSIHCNANPNKSVKGTESYAMGVDNRSKNKNMVELQENSVILMEENYLQKYDGFDPRSEEAYIMFSLLQHAFLKESLKLASEIEAHMQSITKRHSRGVKQAAFVVLWKTSMPSVLSEIGFLSNTEEEKYLRSEVGQNQIAKAIYKGIVSYASKN